MAIIGVPDAIVAVSIPHIRDVARRSACAETRFPGAAIVKPAQAILVGDSSEYFLSGSGPSWTTTPNTAPYSSSGKPDGYPTNTPKRHRDTANYLFAARHVVALSPAEALVAIAFKP